MPNLLNIQEKENKLIKRKNGNPFQKKVLQINRTDKTTINSALFRDIFSNFSKKYGAENLIIRGLSNTGIFTGGVFFFCFFCTVPPAGVWWVKFFFFVLLTNIKFIID